MRHVDGPAHQSRTVQPVRRAVVPCNTAPVLYAPPTDRPVGGRPDNPLSRRRCQGSMTLYERFSAAAADVSRQPDASVGCLGAAIVMVGLLVCAGWESYGYWVFLVLLIPVIFVALLVREGRKQNAADRAADRKSQRRAFAADTMRTVDGFRKSELRATNQDRELTADLLAKALGAGSLSVDEYSERSAAAAAAVHRSTLYGCLKDLDIVELAGPPSS
ncbi:DUF1707 domain-containing protein [Dactylosporangium sp. NPDC006015]|uniref:DUF1707 SHOCT-like domain-containing protein n=1 Tax=Dactylosporangium sp. NPDC006015 TaxID=3154576 RepID=UPI0033B3740C